MIRLICQCGDLIVARDREFRCACGRYYTFAFIPEIGHWTGKMHTAHEHGQAPSAER